MPPCSAATAWPLFAEPLGQPVGVTLGAGEDQGLLDRALGQKVVEQRRSCGPGRRPSAAAARCRHAPVGVRGDVDALRVAQQVLRQAADMPAKVALYITVWRCAGSGLGDAGCRR
jgi:hypothetical protein